MSIPSQLPQIIAAARGGALQALALQAGQMLDGKVIGPAPNGGTQVQISGQMLNLVLPVLAKAGETLKFEVQGSGAQLRLALQPAPAPANPAPSAPPPTASILPRPSNSLPSAQPAVTSPSSTQLAPPAPQTVSIPETTTPRMGQQAVAASPAAQPNNVAAPSVSTAAGNSAAFSGQTQPQAASTAVPSPAQNTVTQAPISSQVASGNPAPLTTVLQPQLIAAPAQPYPSAPPRPAATTGQTQILAPSAVTPAGVQVGDMSSHTQMGQPAKAPVPTSAPAPSTPMTPQAALAQMVQAALPRQDGITSLTAALSTIAGKVALPEPVARAAQQILAGRVAVDGGKLDAATLQKAILRSGIFQEAALARPGSPIPTPQTDMKSALLALRQTLTTWLGQQAPLAPASHISPPMRGHVPRAKPADGAGLDLQAAPEEIGKQLLERTEAALSRVRLHQNASLPDPVARGTEWSMDLPVLIGTYQTLLQLQIHRDQEDASESPAERGWQLRFALNLPDMGEVGAQVSLRGQATGVMLWATELHTSETLEAEIGTLRDTLAAVGLKPGAIIVRHGEPPAPPPAPSGHLLDAST